MFANKNDKQFKDSKYYTNFHFKNNGKAKKTGKCETMLKLNQKKLKNYKNLLQLSKSFGII